MEDKSLGFFNQSASKRSIQSSARIGVVGLGLAGSEAAAFLAKRSYQVLAFEAKKLELNPAQKIATYAELVCTNSLKSVEPDSAHGILKEEMKVLDSEVLKSAYAHQVPAGGALAVDRVKFSQDITKRLEQFSNIEIIDEVVSNPVALKDKYNLDQVIICTGPLPHSSLENWLQSELCGNDLYFYDAIAPVVQADSLDLDCMYFKDRYSEKEGGDYLNVPLSQQQYLSFVQELVEAKKVPPQNFEEMKFFEACLPIDTMAERGVDTLRFSCMKPVGLEPSKNDKNNEPAPYAVVQLRKENLLGSAFNMVGFQNRLTYSEQVRIFKKLPGFEDASFHKLGSIHRNTFINSKSLLSLDLSSQKYPWLSFAGQMTGVEGYTESASMGLYCAFQLDRKLRGHKQITFPKEMAIGALVHYLFSVSKPEPSSINFGLFPEVKIEKSDVIQFLNKEGELPPPSSRKIKRIHWKKAKRKMISDRANNFRINFFNQYLDLDLDKNEK